MLAAKDNIILALNKIRVQRNGFFALTVILSIAILFLSFVLFRLNTKIILVPSLSPDKSIVYNSNSLSDEYYFALASDVVGLFLNISPETIDFNYNRLIKMILPSSRQNMLIELRKIKHIVNTKKLATMFVLNLEKTQIMRSKREVLISGILKTLTSTTITNEENKTYLVKFAFSKGQVFINSISEVEDVQKN